MDETKRNLDPATQLGGIQVHGSNNATRPESEFKMESNLSPKDWTCQDVSMWLKENGHGELAGDFSLHGIDGKALLLLTEDDVKNSIEMTLGQRKRLGLSIRLLQMDNRETIIEMGYNPSLLFHSPHQDEQTPPHVYSHYCKFHNHCTKQEDSQQNNELLERSGVKLSDDGMTSEELQPEVWKTLLSLFYLFVVTWITAFVMVVVHDRVPDMKKYPPLPDIFLDNVPTIPWAFSMCELTGTFLLIIWLFVLTFHKHRFILLRRFFALSGTVFLLRCVTMLITSLSVPGTHLQCNPRVDEHWDRDEVYTSLSLKIQRAYIIWRGAGMSIQGVRTCGDYMFSGHTVALTMLNFFITEYTPRHLYFVHTFTWILNMFGIFFILSAHEHYSIDVFIAFYISSRLFLYYHTLANNQALMQRDSNRTRIWFPLFSFFESSVHGIVPNEYESPLVPLGKLFNWAQEHVTRFAVVTMHNTQAQITNKRTASRDKKTD